MDKYSEILQELMDYKSVYKNAKIAYRLNEIHSSEYKLFIVDLIEKIQTLMKENEAFLLENRPLLNKFQSFTIELKADVDTLGFGV